MLERQDLLVPAGIREIKGAYFTPQIWVEKSQEYLARALYRTAEGSFRLVFRQYIKALPTLKIPSYQTGFADAASAHDYGEPCR